MLFGMQHNKRTDKMKIYSIDYSYCVCPTDEYMRWDEYNHCKGCYGKYGTLGYFTEDAYNDKEILKLIKHFTEQVTKEYFGDLDKINFNITFTKVELNKSIKLPSLI